MLQLRLTNYQLYKKSVPFYKKSVALHKPADNNGHGFVHTYRLMNGRGYQMSTDSNLGKWAWIRAYLQTDEWA